MVHVVRVSSVHMESLARYVSRRESSSFQFVFL